MEIHAVESEKKSDVELSTTSANGSQKDVAAGVAESEGLQRGLNSWHLQFIAIGSAIGTGLVSFQSIIHGGAFSVLTCCSSSAAGKRSRRQDPSGA